jgi:thymidylate synthase (FAD)
MTDLNELDDKFVLSGAPIQVLDHGHVRVVDKMGDDAAIVQAARVSYGKGTKTAREDAELINYLLRHQHTTPFEMCVLKLHCKMPIFVARQWVRHRTASINEYSCRYSAAPDHIYMPESERIKLQSLSNKQGSGDATDMGDAELFLNTTASVQNVSVQALQFAESKGVARELGRINMTVAHYTEWYWCINLHNLLNFLRLRLDPHAQEEMREYAQVILRIVQAWCPATYDAFMQYVYHRESFSLKEQGVLAPITSALLAAIKKDGGEPPPELNFSKGEWQEFLKKLEGIGSLYEDSVA